MPGFSLAATCYDDDARKAGCARRVIGAQFPNVLSYTLEISMFNAPAVTSRQSSPQGKKCECLSCVANDRAEGKASPLSGPLPCLDCEYLNS